ncbi:MAG: hypothetical protein NT025_02810 [bacterium]|nr:hypothetical protein [bacterium]
MSTARVLRVLHRGLSGLYPLLLLALALASGSCRHKNNPVGPDTTQPGQWTMYLRAPLVMYRDQVGGHVINDTIIVRVFNAEGQWKAGVLIRSQASVSHDSVTPTASTWGDTTIHWWGCDGAIIYWGSGGVDGQETVHSWAIWHGDTVAEASVSFKVMDPL